MTLKLRNRLFIALFFLSVACILSALALWVAAALSGAIVPPPVLRLPSFQGKIPFLRYHFSAAILSISILVLYVPVTMIIVYRAFENTQSSEIIFFAGFLLSCLCEGSRILIPLFALGESFSQLQLFSGRILLIGRLLAPLSFVTAAIMSDVEHRQDIERNFMIMVAVATLFAMIIPLNTARISSSCTITWGFPQLVVIIRLLMVLAATLSFWISGLTRDSRELKHSAAASLVLIAGYQMLAVADNYVCLGLGLLLLGGGTYFMLSNLHTLYMWK